MLLLSRLLFFLKFDTFQQNMNYLMDSPANQSIVIFFVNTEITMDKFKLIHLHEMSKCMLQIKGKLDSFRSIIAQNRRLN